MLHEVDSLLAPLRTQIQRSVRTFVSGSPEPPPPRDPELDPGLFGPGSVTWRVHADSSMFVGGLRSLLFQTLHPPTMQGVADHSAYKTDPLRRFQRTASFVGITTFGTTADATAAIEAVGRIHDRVTGTLPDGTPYRANDPHLLGWVHATEVDSFLRAYRRYGNAPLSLEDADRYVAEMARVAELMGIASPPRDRESLAATLKAYRPELGVSRATRDAVRFLLVPPMPLVTRPVYGVVAGAAVALLPTYARRLLWLPIAPGSEPLVVRPAATALVRTLNWALDPAGRAA